MGDQTVKNIAKPVRTYRILSERARIEPKQVLALPDKPSIAVLPFQNMSGDPEVGQSPEDCARTGRRLRRRG
jgi:adenylate cyclase